MTHELVTSNVESERSTIITCNICTEPTPADFYIIEPIGTVNYWRPVCTSCGLSHVSNVPTSSLQPITAPLTETDLYNLCLQALQVTTTETINGSVEAAQIRMVAKRELRRRLSQ